MDGPSGPSSPTGGSPLPAGGSGWFTNIVTALNQLAQALYSINKTLGNSYISLAGNNTFTGNQIFSGTVTANGAVTVNNTADLAGRTTFGSGLNYATRVVTAAGAVAVAATDGIVVVNKTVGAATAANLPASPAEGDRYVIADGKGDASTHNITLTPAAGNINGAGTYVINTNYGNADVVYTGAQWLVIS